VNRYVVILIALGTVSVCAADFNRYQVILDRMPFGAEVVAGAGGAGAAEVQAAAAEVVKTLKMCAITRQALTGALQVGLVDTATKKNYFIAVGETEDGITVVEADYDDEKALLRREGKETWINMSDVASMAAAPAAPVPGPGRLRMPIPPAGGAGLGAGERFVRQRDAGLAALQARRAVTNSLSGQALQKHLEQYQMDLIRSRGEKGPPLPIPLTPEMDQQLVQEGVLAPQ
jgi:hypothetical protein